MFRKLSNWFFEHRPTTKAYDAGYKLGYQHALLNLEGAKVVWDYNVGGVHTDQKGMIDKPATIKRWKEAHVARWNQAANYKDYTHLDRSTNTRRSLQEAPWTVAEHERYLEVFPDLKEN